MTKKKNTEKIDEDLKLREDQLIEDMCFGLITHKEYKQRWKKLHKEKSE